MRRANIFEVALEPGADDPPGFQCTDAHITRLVGGRDLAVRVYDLPPGQSICPYHYEYEEEWLIVLEGALTLRTPEGQAQLARGDAVCFDAGPAGAHKVTNDGAQLPARVLMFSSTREPAVAVYPDSDKIGVFTPDRADRLMVRRADGQRDYWDGERPGDAAPAQG